MNKGNMSTFLKIYIQSKISDEDEYVSNIISFSTYSVKQKNAFVINIS